MFHFEGHETDEYNLKYITHISTENGEQSTINTYINRFYDFSGGYRPVQIVN